MERKTARPDTPREAKVITVVQVTSGVGMGTVDDIHRLAKTYWSLDGKFLALFDPMNPPPFVSVDGRGEASLEPEI